MKLSEAIEGYLRMKRANGLGYVTEEYTLLAFRRHVNDPPLEEITPKQVIEFLNSRNCSNSRWMAKHSCLRMFFEFWTDREQMSAFLMPQAKRRETLRVAMSYIYTRTQIRKLIQATHGNQAHGRCATSEATLKTVLLTLYGTGATTHEIISLRRDDLDLKRNLVLLRGDRIIQPRRVPLNKDLRELLISYIRCERSKCVPSSPNLFVTNRGGPIPVDQLVYSFARLRVRAGVVRVDAGVRKPRMCDIRPTFAVHRIASWIKEGTDLNRMLPALSAYMGYAGCYAAQRFLLLTPERFKRELDVLSPRKPRKHWRDDPELMRFLASL